MAEEIVRIIKVDTKNSGKSIKDLRNEIKSLRTELEKTEVGSEEFSAALKKLTQTQKEYNSVQQQVRDMSKTNQQDMVRFASFAQNLGKAYSALNAAVGLFANKNEDVQKAMLRVQRTIQLVQGLDGIAGLVRDIPKVLAGFRNWFNTLDPIERRVNNIVKGINGVDPKKIQAINEANRAGQGGSASASASVSAVKSQAPQIDADTDAYGEQTKVITALNAARDELQGKIVATQKKIEDETKALNEQKSALTKSEGDLKNYEKRMDGLRTAYQQQKGSMSELTVKVQQANETMKAQGKTMANIWDPAVKAHSEAVLQLGKLQKQIKATEGNIISTEKAVTTAKANVDNLTKSIAANEVVLQQDQKRFAELTDQINGTSKASAQLGTFFKNLGKTVGWTLLISTVITLVYKLWDYVKATLAAAQAQKQLNKEINQTTNQIASKQIVVLKELALAYGRVGDSAKAKEQFLDDYKDKIKETGIAIDDVKKAEDVFVNNTDKYVKAIMARAQAQAIESKAIDLYKEYLDERYDLEQKLIENNERLSNIKPNFAAPMGSGMNTSRDLEVLLKASEKIANQIAELEAKTNKRLGDMFKDVAGFQKIYEGIFGSVSSGGGTSGGARVDFEMEYKESLEALKNYVQDYLDVFKDARTKELDDNRRAYDQNIQDINENFAKGVEAARGNAEKLIEIDEEKNKALEFARLAFNRRTQEIIDKYNQQALEDERKHIEEQIALIDESINRIQLEERFKNAKLKEPREEDYQTNWFIFGAYAGTSQTFPQIEAQKQAEINYNNEYLANLRERIEAENAELQKQLEVVGITEEKKLEIETKIAENEKELSNSVRDTEIANTNAKIKAQLKYQAAVQAAVQVAGSLTGAIANMYKVQAQDEKKSAEEREEYAEKYKAWAKAQAIIDTFAAANSAFRAMAEIPPAPAWGIAAAAAAIIAGMANVRAIEQESVVSSMSSSVSGSSVSAPAPLSTAPIEYTRNLVGDKELDEINQPIKCYVLEQDITKSQNKVKVTEQNATF